MKTFKQLQESLTGKSLSAVWHTLTEYEKNLIIQALRRFHSGDAPWPMLNNLRFFQLDHVKEVLYNATKVSTDKYKNEFRSLLDKLK